MTKSKAVYLLVRRVGATLLSLLSLSSIVRASAHERQTCDTLSTHLNEIEVTAESQSLLKKGNSGSVDLNVKRMGRYIRTLGEADPVKYVQMLPGVTTSDDYASGFSVWGSDYSQNLVQLDGATVWFPYHFGGVFSMLNPNYFHHIRFDRHLPQSASEAKLSALLDATSTNEIASHPSASLNIGMITSCLYADIPLARRWNISIAGRISYLNLLYRPLLNGEDQSYRYNLHDLNASLLYKPDNRNGLKLNFHTNRDDLDYMNDGQSNQTGIVWGNKVSSFLWHNEGTRHNSELFFWYSRLDADLSLDMGTISASSESMICQWGVKEVFQFKTSEDTGKWDVGALVSGYTFSPARIYSSFAAGTEENIDLFHAIESKAFGTWEGKLSDRFSLKPGMGVFYYSSQGYTRLFISPTVNGTCVWNDCELTFDVGYRPQFFHQAGLSEFGLASNFWIGSSPKLQEQSALMASIEWSWRFGNGGWELTVAPYGGYIWNEGYYTGSVFDLLTGDFNPYEQMAQSHGFNTGFDISLKRTRGRLTGWVSTSLGFARRRFHGNPDKWLPSANESLATVKCFAAYRLNTHWEFGASFNFATGHPYTPVTEVLFIGGNIMMAYGELNTGRLPAYHRLDLSASYSFKTGGKFPLSHMLNFSLLNAYGHINTEFIYYRYSAQQNKFIKENTGSLFRFLPSLSYTIEY